MTGSVSLTLGVAPWSPADMSELTAWIDYSDPASLFIDAGSTLVSADADAIYQANDKSGSGNHAIQTNGTLRPLYKTSIVNGRSVARFDGIDDVMTLTTATVGVAGTYVFVCAKRAAPSGSYLNLWSRDAANAQILTNSALSATDWVWYRNGTPAVEVLTGATAAAWAILSVVHTDASAMLAYYNGSLVASFNPHDDVTTATLEGLGNYAGGGQAGDVDVAQHLYCDSALDAASHDQVGMYLAGQYGLSWTAIA